MTFLTKAMSYTFVSDIAAVKRNLVFRMQMHAYIRKYSKYSPDPIPPRYLEICNSVGLAQSIKGEKGTVFNGQKLGSNNPDRVVFFLQVDNKAVFCGLVSHSGRKEIGQEILTTKV